MVNRYTDREKLKTRLICQVIKQRKDFIFQVSPTYNSFMCLNTISEQIKHNAREHPLPIAEVLVQNFTTMSGHITNIKNG